ncbi:hypothetical protein Tco_1506390, partial [Tanacetum coccineum]
GDQILQAVSGALVREFFGYLGSIKKVFLGNLVGLEGAYSCSLFGLPDSTTSSMGWGAILTSVPAAALPNAYVFFTNTQAAVLEELEYMSCVQNHQVVILLS